MQYKKKYFCHQSNEILYKKKKIKKRIKKLKTMS